MQYTLLSLMVFLLCFLALEQIKLSFEISRLHTNQQNLLTEYENFKDTNLKLVTQFHTNNSPASIEKEAKEDLGMIKIETKKIIVEKSTLPVRTAERLKEVINANKNENVNFEIISNPEFLAE